MSVDRCDGCGTYFEGARCTVCGRKRELATTATQTAATGRPWELGGEDVPAPETSLLLDDEPDPWQPTNPYAIVSVTLGLLGVSLLAIIFGRIALRQIDQYGRETGRVPATIGVVVGSIWLVGQVIAVIVKLTGS